MAGRRGRTTTALVPAALRAPEVLSPEDTVSNAAAVEVFATAVGGRDALIETLSVAHHAPEAEHIVNLLIDPRFSTTPLPKLCTMAGLTVADLFAAYRKALIARAHIKAAHIVADKLPPIVEDVMNRAMPHQVPCPQCHGRGEVNPSEPDEPAVRCGRCAGTGSVTRQPDLRRQKLALELGQLTEKKAGLVVNQNAIAAASGGAAAALTSHGRGSLEQLQQAVGDMLFAPGRTRAASPRTVPVPTSEPDEEPEPEEEPDPDTEPDDEPDPPTGAPA